MALMSEVTRTRDDKFHERREQLGEATLQTLAALGYARTSLREIAQNSEFSHGVLHYYFNDKVDLILCSVRQYKARCVTRYDVVTVEATAAEELVENFCAKLTETLQRETSMHRLWYDLRSQSMFEPTFRPEVDQIEHSLEQMIWRVLTRYAELLGQQLQVDSSTAYALMDGLFQQALHLHVAGQVAEASERLSAATRRLLPLIVA